MVIMPTRTFANKQMYSEVSKILVKVVDLFTNEQIA